MAYTVDNAGNRHPCKPYRVAGSGDILASCNTLREAHSHLRAMHNAGSAVGHLQAERWTIEGWEPARQPEYSNFPT